MKVKFIGGPVHGISKDVPVDDNDKPLPFFDYYPMEPIKLIAADPSPKDKAVKVDRYKLEEIWRDGRLSHYEFHHVGR